MFSIELTPTIHRSSIFNVLGSVEETFFCRLSNCAGLIMDYGFEFTIEVGSERDADGANNFVYAVSGVPTAIAAAVNHVPFEVDLDPQNGMEVTFEPSGIGFSTGYKNTVEHVEKQVVVDQLVKVLDRFREIVGAVDPSLSASAVFNQWLSIEEYAGLTNSPFDFVSYDGELGDLFDEHVPEFVHGFNLYQQQLAYVADRIAESFSGLSWQPSDIRGFDGTFDHGESVYNVMLDSIVHIESYEGDFIVCVEGAGRSHVFQGRFESVVADWKSGWNAAMNADKDG